MEISGIKDQILKKLRKKKKLPIFVKTNVNHKKENDSHTS